MTKKQRKFFREHYAPDMKCYYSCIEGIAARYLGVENLDLSQYRIDSFRFNWDPIQGYCNVAQHIGLGGHHLWYIDDKWGHFQLYLFDGHEVYSHDHLDFDFSDHTDRIVEQMKVIAGE